MARKTVKMVNIYPGPVTFQIDGMPGTEGVEYTVEKGEHIMLDEAWCKPVQGAGTNTLPAIIDRLTMRTWPDSEVRAPGLAREDELKARKADVERRLKAEEDARKANARKAAALLAGAAAGAQS